MCTSKLEVTDLNKMSIFMQKKEATGQAKQFLTVKYSLLIQVHLSHDYMLHGMGKSKSIVQQAPSTQLT